MGKYQEQAQLLDPLLEGIVQPLAAVLRAAAADPAAADPARVRGVSRLLWQLAVVRCVLIEGACQTAALPEHCSPAALPTAGPSQ